MLNSKILVIFNPICLVSVKNRHIDQNQEKIGTKSAYADKYRHADRQIGLTETLLRGDLLYVVQYRFECIPTLKKIEILIKI